MRPTPNFWVERYRVKHGPMASHRWDGNNGAFVIPMDTGAQLFCIASDGLGWDHVSIIAHDHPNDAGRVPTWPEMTHIKELFWDAEECVWQYHPPHSVYVNQHPAVLHLWRKQDYIMPLPDPELVGIPTPGAKP